MPIEVIDKIKYSTDGKVLIECPIGNQSPLAITWQVGDMHVSLHRGHEPTLRISKSQLEQIGELAAVIAADLK